MKNIIYTLGIVAALISGYAFNNLRHSLTPTPTTGLNPVQQFILLENDPAQLGWIAQDCVSKNQNEIANALFNRAESIEAISTGWRQFRICYVRSLLRCGRVEEADNQMDKAYEEIINDPQDYPGEGQSRIDFIHRVTGLQSEFPWFHKGFEIIVLPKT